MEYTPEDQLVADFVAYWNQSRPSGIPDAIPFVHFRRTEVLPIPAIIIGHEGYAREVMKGMTGTARVNFRIALRSDLDVTPAADHRAIISALDQAIADITLPNGPLDLTYLHAILREAPAEATEDRRMITALRYIVVCTRCAES